MSKLNISNWIDCTEVEGPGKRFALWVQGCCFHCQGCCNPGMQPFILKTLMESSDVCFLIQLAKEKHDIEGVTFLGGEPMLQAKGLSEVADWCNKNDLSVMTFTGYTLENLCNENIAGVETLIANTDILVDGRYDEMLQETERNWVGSRNQCFYFLTNRYEKEVVYDTRYAHSVELRIRSDGTIQSNGFPFHRDLASILDMFHNIFIV